MLEVCFIFSIYFILYRLAILACAMICSLQIIQNLHPCALTWELFALVAKYSLFISCKMHLLDKKLCHFFYNADQYYLFLVN